MRKSSNKTRHVDGNRGAESVVFKYSESDDEQFLGSPDEVQIFDKDEMRDDIQRIQKHRHPLFVHSQHSFDSSSHQLTQHYEPHSPQDSFKFTANHDQYCFKRSPSERECEIGASINIQDTSRPQTLSTRHNQNDELSVAEGRTIRGRPKKTDKFNWSDGSTKMLIDLWEDKKVLYDVKHPDYHKPEKKETAINEIRESLAASGIQVNDTDITSKFISLRSYFSQERVKTISSKNDGNDSIYESRWKFYARLMFLNDNMVPRGIYSNVNFNDDVSNQNRMKCVKRTLEDETGKSKPSSVSDSQMSSCYVSEVQYGDSEDDIFGALIVKKLKKLAEGPKKEEVKMKMLIDLNKAHFTSSRQFSS